MHTPSHSWFPFFIATALCSLILLLFPYNRQKLENSILTHPGNSAITNGMRTLPSQCTQYTFHKKSSPLPSRFFKLTSSNTTPILNCQILVTKKEKKGFFIAQKQVYFVSVFHPTTQQEIKRFQFQQSIPSPIILLPFLIFFLCLIFQTPLQSWLLHSLIFALFIAEFNMVKLIFHQVPTVLSQWFKNSNNLGFFLIAMWLIIFQSKEKRFSSLKIPVASFQRLIHKLIQFIIPSWTRFSRIKSRTSKVHIKKTLSQQELFITLGGLILMAPLVKPEAALSQGHFFSIRLFCIACFFYALIRVSSKDFKRFFSDNRQPHPLLRYIMAHFTIEILAYLTQLNTVIPWSLRAGLGLLLTELVTLSQFTYSQKKIIQRSLILLSSLTLISLFVSSGGIHLLYQLLDPVTHPRLFQLYTFIFAFICGLFLGDLFLISCLGFLTPFFVELPIAICWDGLIAGIIFSPLSLFNQLSSWNLNKVISFTIHERINALIGVLGVSIVGYLLGLIQHFYLLQMFGYLLCLLIFIRTQLTLKPKWLRT